ncbi:hypothetical protein EGN72_14610 [Pseudorhodobacter sp. E13]|uniref:hypothetical protein n=1 Tax=Pseudorhodobacter sp. E13 TaxID=2487931 RepID=UPI000F8C316E|nr:hypothetical protein [Pseudorhodobacter sp. E13]RUS59178.1 hypothetical protein EGN72_14610 [Pseudorhodobacter sp. E13]
MWDFSISQALGLMRRTAPFLMFRVIVYFGITAALVIVTGTGAGLGWGIGNFGDEEFRATATGYGALGGFGLTAGVIFFFRDYLLYIVKAGHIAVMVELMTGGEVPDGRGQIDYAKEVVKARFGEASALFALDRVIKGVVGAITGLVQGLMSILPIPGLSNIMGVVRAYLRVAVGLVDEVILAHAIKTRATNPWASAREALVLYGQNARPMLINAAWLTAIVYGLSFVVFLLMLAPAAAIVYLMPGAWSAGGLVFAIIFAWAVKAALIEPFAIACLLQVFFKVTEGQRPNPEWEAKLDKLSDKFRGMAAKASAWVTGAGRNAAPGKEL